MPRNPQPAPDIEINATGRTGTSGAPVPRVSLRGADDPPPPAAPDTSAGRAVIVVIPPGPYSPQEYADAAAAMARDFQYHPTPAPQLAEALRRAVSGWADAQQLSH